MAQQEPPESLVIGAFAGIRNLVAAERLAPGELEAAVNVDIDDAGQLRRRRGQTQVSDAAHHSLWANGERAFVVRDGVLGRLYTDYTFTALTTVGADPLGYANVGETTYFTSRSISGKILPDNTVAAWGVTGGEGTWLSPVIRPTDTLGAISGQLLGPPPLAQIIEPYNGRIYLADEKWLWATELYLYDYVDRTRNYIQFEQDITMLAAVEGGLYVGTTAAVYFLAGAFSQGMERRTAMAAGPLRGSCVRAPAEAVNPAARNGPVPTGEAVVFMTTDGVCAGLPGGQVINLTRGRTGFPDAQSAAALYREQDGVNQYVAVTDSAGTPSEAVRIGDYMDAEIRRFGGTAQTPVEASLTDAELLVLVLEEI